MTPSGEGALRILSAGAAKGVVEALAGPFEAPAGIALAATFDAAGTIRDAFVAGARCDVLILPAAMLAALAGEARVERDSIAALGSVPTGIAVAHGDPIPAVGDAAALRASLAAAPALYCPDTERATAGIHFAAVLRALRIEAQAAAKLRAHPNGALAMAALAREGVRGAIGCTQVTEILYTPGIDLVAPLPAPFELATIYAVAVSRRAADPARARAFAARIAGPESEALRREGGFYPAAPSAAAPGP